MGISDGERAKVTARPSDPCTHHSVYMYDLKGASMCVSAERRAADRWQSMSSKAQKRWACPVSGVGVPTHRWVFPQLGGGRIPIGSTEGVVGNARGGCVRMRGGARGEHAYVMECAGAHAPLGG